jgi:hypothetical protein
MRHHLFGLSGHDLPPVNKGRFINGAVKAKDYQLKGWVDFCQIFSGN